MKLKSLYLAAAIATVTILPLQASAVCFNLTPQAMSNVTANANGTFHYDINAWGGTHACGTISGPDKPGYMGNFYLPYFDDMGITGLTVSQNYGPTGLGWAVSIEATNDLFHLGGGVLHFYATSIPQTLDYNSINIDFDAGFGQVKAPFAMTLTDISTGASRDYLGDPGIPGSPKTIAALDAPQGQDGTVPEPATLSLFALGTAALLARRRKKA